MAIESARTRLVRGRGKIHLAFCRHAVNVGPWFWAEGRPDEEWIRKPWLVPCRVCLPDLAKAQDALRKVAPRG